LRLEADGFEIIADTVVPGRLPDLFSGAPVLILGRYRGTGKGTVVVRAKGAAGRPWSAAVTARGSGHSASASVWARGHIRELEDRLVSGPGDWTELEQRILTTSLRFGVLCRFTAFVAVDRVEAVNRGGSRQQVTQAVEAPAGWEMGAEQYEEVEEEEEKDIFETDFDVPATEERFFADSGLAFGDHMGEEPDKATAPPLPPRPVASKPATKANKLQQLVSRMEGNDKLEALLGDVLKDAESFRKMAPPADPADKGQTSPGASLSSGSLQHKLSACRGGRVAITYELETEGCMARAALPFVIGVLADLSGQPTSPLPPLKSRKSLLIDRDNFNDIMERLAPRLVLTVPNRLEDQPASLQVELLFRQIEDFEPVRVAAQVAVLRELLESASENLAARNRKLSVQLAAILHHPDFRRLEAAWRGLWYLVMQTETGELLKIRVLNVSKQELLADQRAVAAFDQSVLFQKVYADEYDQSGGQPYSLLLGDYEFSHQAEDVWLLQRIAQVAAAAHAPFVAAASPQLLGVRRFKDLAASGNLSKLFAGEEHAAWCAFQVAPESCYVGLTLPRVLARLPYGVGGQPVAEFGFEEFAEGKDHDQFPWMSAAWAFAARVTDAFAKYGWCARLCGVGGGGKLEGILAFAFPHDGPSAGKRPAELFLSDPRSKELAQFGLLPLACPENSAEGLAYFAAAPSCHQPQPQNAAATDDAAWTVWLNFLLCVSRYVHCLKVQARDRLYFASDVAEVQRGLNDWLKDHVLEDLANAPYYAKSRQPLAEIRVEIQAAKDRPGRHELVVWLRPHYHFAAPTATVRLVAEIPRRTS
jgi:type VI secretion system protein ImpC